MLDTSNKQMTIGKLKKRNNKHSTLRHYTITGEESPLQPCKGCTLSSRTPHTTDQCIIQIQNTNCTSIPATKTKLSGRSHSDTTKLRLLMSPRSIDTILKSNPNNECSLEGIIIEEPDHINTSHILTNTKNTKTTQETKH
jgi:hypothetical protein